MDCHCCAESGHGSPKIAGAVFHRLLDGEIRHVCRECAKEIDEALEPDGESANPADFMKGVL